MGGNGHLYDAVRVGSAISWDTARARAKARGSGWDLATITSREENDFVKGLFIDKPWTIYHPDEARYLRNDGVVVDPDRPDHDPFPEFRKARATYDFVLRPGETVLVPHGWYHAAKTLTDSISLTWNFVHRSTSAALLAWLKQPMSEIDQSVLRFFFGPAVDGDVTPAAIEALRGVALSCYPWFPMILIASCLCVLWSSSSLARWWAWPWS